MKTIRMKYRQYKTSYSDCDTMPNSYDKATKTIEVLIPDGRIKNSGVRGESYKHLWFNGTDNKTGKPVRICIKAICVQNAIKRLPKDCTWDLSAWGL